jgi:hypothetical protein
VDDRHKGGATPTTLEHRDRHFEGHIGKRQLIFPSPEHRRGRRPRGGAAVVLRNRLSRDREKNAAIIFPSPEHRRGRRPRGGATAASVVPGCGMGW